MNSAISIARIPQNTVSAQPNLTKGCRIVLEALEQSKELSSAQDIYGRLRIGGENAPGLTTVYRSLEMLVSYGLVQVVDLGDGEKRYEVVAPGEHHHHLVCDKCKTSTHLDQCLVEDIETAIQKKYGFEIRSHVLELFGVCAECNKSENK